MLKQVFRAQRAVSVRQVAMARFYSAKQSADAQADAGDAQAAAGDAQAAAGDATADASADTSAINPEFEQLQKKFNDKDQECAKFKAAYQRSVADFQNLQRTTEVEKKKAKDFALQGFAKDLLSTVDNFDFAMKSVREEDLSKTELKNFHDGVQMVQSAFEKTLESNGLIKTNPIGEKFDPKVHEAVFMVAQPDKEDGTIFNVQQTGFVYNDRVLRAPKVGVVKNS